MKNAAVLIAPGFEEGETMTIVDILRRCDIHCTIYGTSKEVEGAHHIVLKSDAPISRSMKTRSKSMTCSSCRVAGPEEPIWQLIRE